MNQANNDLRWTAGKSKTARYAKRRQHRAWGEGFKWWLMMREWR